MTVKGKSRWVGQVGKRLVQHLENKTSDAHLTSQVHHFNQKEVYQSPARDRVARCAPFPLLPSSLLQKGHSYADRYHRNGPSVLVHKSDSDGQIRAFSNKCRHRGSQLVKDGEHIKGPAVSCPYHAWTYDARSGSLKGITAHQKCFPNVQKDQLSLHPLPCFEQAGFIWIGGTGMKEKHLWSLSEVHTELMSILPTAGASLLAYREWTLQANWQLIVETFLEAYHVTALHNKTLAAVAHSAMVADVLDKRSLRVSVPLKNFDASLYDETVDNFDDEKFFEQSTTTYFLYPHTAVSLSKRFLFFVSIDPLGEPDCASTSSRVRSWAVKRTPDPNDGDLALRDVEKFTVGIEEDWICAEDIGQGICANGAPGLIRSSSHAYGLYEGGNVMFLKNVRDAAKQL